jgi:hypothetical protein
MIQCFAALTSRGDEYRKILFDLVLPDQVGSFLGTEGVVDAIVRLGFRI